jgi:hypothetical protein
VVNNNNDDESRRSLFQQNLASVNVESPGKYSSKLHQAEKELAHESHLIHNQMQQRQSNVENRQDESFARASRNQNLADESQLSVQQHKAQMLSQQMFIPKSQQPGTMHEGPKSYNFGGKQSNGAFGETSFDMEFMMPPDIMSIDSDINKIGALTPSPFIDGAMD